MRDKQQLSIFSMPYRDLADLSGGMIGVREGQGARIAENRRGLFKCHAMLAEISAGLRGVPLEQHGCQFTACCQFPFAESHGVFAPDGSWVAYQSNESGRLEIYVRPFPGPGGQWQISTGGGNSPRWRADGKELYYLAPDNKLMAVAVSGTGGALLRGAPEVLFQTHIARATNRHNYDVARDGRFLIDTEIDDASTEPIHLLLNWNPPK